MDTDDSMAHAPPPPPEAETLPVQVGWPESMIPVDIPSELKQRFQQHSGPVEVKVRVTGLNRTQPSMISDEIRAIESQTTVAGVLDQLLIAKERWADMEIFRDVSLEGFSPTAEGGGKMLADIRFVEGDKMTLGVFTDANKVAPEVRFNKNNLFGLGYSVFVDLQPTKNVGVVIPPEAATPSAFVPIRDFMQSTFPTLNSLMERGSGYCLSTMSLFKVGVRSVKPAVGRWTEYGIGRSKETHMRNRYSDEWVMDTGVSVGFGQVVRQTLSLSTKQRSLMNGETKKLQSSELNGFHYDATIDQRQYNGAQPNAGWAAWFALQCAGSYAGLPSTTPAVNHMKMELKTHHILPVIPSLLSLQLQTKLGTLFTSEGVRVNDRYYAESEYVRGFLRVGQQFPEGGGLRGGDVIGAVSALASFPLSVPILPEGAFGGHLFVNAAGVGLSSEHHGSRWKALRDTVTASCGAGVHIAAVPLLGTMGRLEFNFSHPLTPAAPAADDFKRWRFGLLWAA